MQDNWRDLPQFQLDFESPEFKPFEKVVGEVSIPIDYSGAEYEFTNYWFRNRNQATWSTFLLPRFGDGRQVDMIQIGCWQGLDSLFSYQHLLMNPHSHMTVIDPWLPTTKKSAEEMEENMRMAMWNLQEGVMNGKISVIRGLSQDVLPTMQGEVDLVIVDGDHRASAVRQDAENALRLLKPGGWMVFDDVRQKKFKQEEVPAGLALFFQKHDKEVKLVFKHRFCDCYEKL